MTLWIGLFVTCFLAATLLPFPSEGAVIGAVYAGGAPVWVVLVATVGNTLGALTGYGLGRLGRIEAVRRRLGINDIQLARASRWFERWGWPVLLLTWVPVVGDPLTVVAGLMQTRWWLFAAVVALGKCARYAVVAALVA
jgi:membrane protein YqaA with SNARE-associated domain